MNEGESRTVMIVRTPEDRLMEMQELDKLIRDDEEVLATQKAAAQGTQKRIQELSLKLRQLLRTETPLPLFDADSTSSTDSGPGGQ